MKQIVLIFSILAATVAPALGWGGEGHKAIGDIAAARLNTTARAQVIAILGNDDLGAIASWADDVRSAARGHGPLEGDADAAQVNQDFPHNASWHFIDMPLGSASYADAAKNGFSPKDDVIHAIKLCVATLDGTASKTPPTLTKATALKLLVHFVGDMHQPLHCCSGYYTFDADGTAHLVTDPAKAKGLEGDKGGNDLRYGTSRYEELHAFWDVDVVEGYANSKDAAVLATNLQPLVSASASRDDGDYHKWPEAWATDTLAASRKVYEGVTIGKAEFSETHKLRQIDVSIDMPSYRKASELVAGAQLAKAGFRLAELLNAIWPAPSVR